MSSDLSGSLFARCRFLYLEKHLTFIETKLFELLTSGSDQEDVFAKIGKGAVSNVLNGYNSTVFAYGQTGSGKTFTVTGGAERYAVVLCFCSRFQKL